MREMMKKLSVWTLCAAMLFSGTVQLPAYAESEPVVEEENPYLYTGFSGIYQKITIDGLTVEQSGKTFILTDDPASDYTVQFLPRDMGDGSYAFENRDSEYRIAFADEGEALPATLYNIRKYLTPNPDSYAGLNDNTQHWIREDAEENKYYLKSLENDLYMGVRDNKLIAVSEEDKATIEFVPLCDQSPLYLLSQNEGYSRLTQQQRDRLERVYESVAGDVFELDGLYAGTDDPKSTPRAKIDNIYKAVLAADNSPDTCYSKLSFYLKPDNAILTKQLQSHFFISMELPGTIGNYSIIRPNGQDLPEQSQNDGQSYECYIDIYDSNGNLEQTISMSVRDNGWSVIANTKMFAEIMPRIPYVLRKNIKYASCYKSSSSQFSTNGNNVAITLQAGCTKDSMLYSVVHELGHSIDRGYGASYGLNHFSYKNEWIEAIKSDIFTLSDYSNTSYSERFAEFCRFYFSGYTNQDWARALEILCPDQYALFKRVRMDYLDGYSLWDDGPEKDVTVSFDYNNGTSAAETVTAKQYSLYSDSIKNIPAPEWEGHRFLGWYTEQSGGVPITDKKRIIDENPHTLYAHWEEVGCSFEPSEVSVMVGGSATLRAVLDGSYTVTDAEWTVENDNVVSISADEDKSTATINGLKPGATSAEVKFTVLPSDEENPITVRKSITITSICGHTYSDWETKTPPTCATAGTQTRTCSVCGKVETQTIPATGNHTSSPAVKENVKNATCGADGSYDEVVYCSVCKAEISRKTVTVPATGKHTFDEWETTKAATCATAGTQTRTCSVCGKTETQTVAATGNHTASAAVKENVKNATCGADGSYEEVVYCSVCKAQISRKTVTAPATGKHAFTEWETTKTATCATAGTQTRICSVCGKTETQTIPATGNHTSSPAVKENVKNATCGTDGSYDEVVYCSVCKAQISRKTVTVPATGKHTFDEWETTKAATCATSGTQTRTCSVCGKTETQTIPATGKHTASAAVKENVKNATCGADGSYEEVVYCSVCKAEISRKTVTVPATGKHTYVDKVFAPTYTAEGYTLHTCSVCGDSYKDTYTAKKTVSAVSGLNIKARAADALRLTWTKNTSADGYIIEMKSGNSWVRVGKITKNSTVEFRKDKLKAGTAYTFRVKAYKMSGSTALYSGYTTISARTNPSAVTGLKLKGRAADALRIAWTKNTSADGYIIEMKSGSTWTRVGKITSNSTIEFKKSKLKAGTAYTFRVKAYKMSGKTALYGATKTISVRTNPSTTSGLKLKNSAKNAVRLSWTKNTSADGYIIEMKSGNSWVRVGKITKNSTIEFKKSGLQAGTAYTFRVKAYKMSGKTALYSGYKTITVKTK